MSCVFCFGVVRAFRRAANVWLGVAIRVDSNSNLDTCRAGHYSSWELLKGFVFRDSFRLSVDDRQEGCARRAGGNYGKGSWGG